MLRRIVLALLLAASSLSVGAQNATPAVADERDQPTARRARRSPVNVGVRRRHLEGVVLRAIDGGRAVSARKDLGLRPDQRAGVGRWSHRAARTVATPSVKRSARPRGPEPVAARRDASVQVPYLRSWCSNARVLLRPDQRLGVGRLQRRVRHRFGRRDRRRRSPSRSRTFRNVGFLLFDGDKGQIYFRLFSYGRYLNQRNLDESYVDAFGNTKTVQRRQDIQLQKFFAPFSGWFLTPKMRYYLYVWSSNPSQGDPAQVVGAGNLTWTFNRFVSVGVGITSLPTVRSTEGSVPVLARRGRSPDCRRVLSGLVHLRRLAQRRAPYQGQVQGDVRQQPEHARRERGAARQQAGHAVLLGRNGCRRPASSACGTRSATTTITRRSRRGSACTTPTASRKSKASREPKASRTARSG